MALGDDEVADRGDRCRLPDIIDDAVIVAGDDSMCWSCYSCAPDGVIVVALDDKLLVVAESVATVKVVGMTVIIMPMIIIMIMVPLELAM